MKEPKDDFIAKGAPRYLVNLLSQLAVSVLVTLLLLLSSSVPFRL